MLIKENGEYPACNVISEEGLIRLTGQFGDDKWSGINRISTDEGNSGT